MVEQQPIGKTLFGQWCELKGTQYHCFFLLLDVEIESDDQRHDLVSVIKQVRKTALSLIATNPQAFAAIP